MKLLTINATYSGGGPGNTTEFIHEELLRTNNESVVICALSRKKSDFVHVLYNKFEINVIKALAKIHIKANIPFSSLYVFILFMLIKFTAKILLSPEIPLILPL